MIGVVVGFRYSKENCEAEVLEETESVRETVSDSARSRTLRGVDADSVLELVESRRETESRKECWISDFVNFRWCGVESSRQQSQQP